MSEENIILEALAGLIKRNFLGSHSSVGMLNISDVSTTHSAAIFSVCWWFGSTETDDSGATKQPAHTEDGSGVNSRNVWELSHPDAALWPRKLMDLGKCKSIPGQALRVPGG